MAHQLFQLPKPVLIGDGAIKPGYKVSFFVTTTTTPAAVYTTSALNVAHTQPVEADAAGVLPPIYLVPTVVYKATVTDAAGVLQYTVDPVNDQILSQAVIGGYLYPTTAAETSAGVTPVNYAYEPGDVRRLGAAGDNSTDDSTAINNALLVGGTVRIPFGLTCKATNLTVGVANTSIIIEGAVSQITATNKLFDVTAANVSIVGPGTVVSPATFDGTNSARTYAVMWVTGNGFVCDGVRFENIPRCGIRLEGVTNCRVSDCIVDGNFPYASYGGTNVGHLFVDIDAPTTSTYDDDVGIVVANNIIKECVQGVFVGNLDSSGTEAGIIMTGNVVVRCWDHGFYGSIGEGFNISGNTFLSTHKPINVSGICGTVVGNTLYSTEDTDSNGQQHIQIRESQGCLVSGNTLYGLAASIFVDCPDDGVADEASDNIISNNTIIRTGSGDAGSAIRLGNFAEVCANNVIENNTIQGGDFTSTVGVIQLEMKPGFTGSNNIVRNNTISSTGVSNGIQIDHHDGTRVYGNRIAMTGNAGSASTVRGVYVISSLNTDVDDNTILYESGGTNVTIRGIQTTGTCTGSRFTNNKFRLTSGSLSGSDALGFIGALFQTGNLVNGGTALATTATENFAYVPTCAGTPTGAASAYTGLAAIVVDTTNHKLYFRSGGAWRDAGP